jgi:hypothetical protein
VFWKGDTLLVFANGSLGTKNFGNPSKGLNECGNFENILLNSQRISLLQQLQGFTLEGRGNGYPPTLLEVWPFVRRKAIFTSRL